MTKLTSPYFIYTWNEKEKKLELKKKVNSKTLSELEKIVKEIYVKKPIQITENQKNYLRNTHYDEDFTSLDSFLKETEQTVEKEADYLGPGVLGMYDLRTDTVYILKGLSPTLKEFIKAHEHAHRRRAYAGESQDEFEVDREAEIKTGINYKRAA